MKNQLRYTREENISCVGGGIYPNMLCAHPPFQIDGNFGFAVAEMLIQSRKGYILLLPALPDEWKDGKVRGMKAQGDITVDFEWREGRIHRVRLCSSHEQKVTLECNGISKTVFLKPDGTENMIFD
ncbi:MAG: glycoside hydrolase family 95-like protein [Blautia wexlerae]